MEKLDKENIKYHQKRQGSNKKVKMPEPSSLSEHGNTTVSDDK